MLPLPTSYYLVLYVNAIFYPDVKIYFKQFYQNDQILRGIQLNSKLIFFGSGPEELRIIKMMEYQKLNAKSQKMTSGMFMQFITKASCRLAYFTA